MCKEGTCGRCLVTREEYIYIYIYIYDVCVCVCVCVMGE